MICVCKLLVWLLKQRQVCPKLSSELLGPLSSCHRCLWCGLCSLSCRGAVESALTSWMCRQAWHSYCVPGDAHQAEVHLRWLKHRAWMFFASYPKGNGFRHVMSQQETEVLRLYDSVAKYPKSNRELRHIGQLWNLWGWPRRGALKKQRCVCQPPALCPVSYSWISVATPCPRLHRQWAEHHFSYLAHFLLHPNCRWLMLTFLLCVQWWSLFTYLIAAYFEQRSLSLSTGMCTQWMFVRTTQ